MRARHATPEPCLHPAILPRLSRAALERIAEAAIAELDRRDTPTYDCEPETEFDECEDDAVLSAHRGLTLSAQYGPRDTMEIDPLDLLPLPSTDLFARRRPVEVRHG